MSVPGGILSLRGGMVGPNSRTIAARPSCAGKTKRPRWAVLPRALLLIESITSGLFHPHTRGGA